MNSPRIQKLKISALRLDGGTQLRESMSQETIAEYADAMREGGKFPPPTVFWDGRDYLLAGGFHRIEAARLTGKSEIDVEVREGTLRDAVLFSAGENANHGLRRTNRDKQRAVQTILGDQEWCKWTDRKIARHCGVSHTFVSNLRAITAQSGNGCHDKEVKEPAAHPKARTMRRDFANVRIPKTLRVECCGKGQSLSERVTELIKLGMEYEKSLQKAEGVPNERKNHQDTTGRRESSR